MAGAIEKRRCASFTGKGERLTKVKFVGDGGGEWWLAVSVQGVAWW